MNKRTEKTKQTHTGTHALITKRKRKKERKKERKQEKNTTHKKERINNDL